VPKIGKTVADRLPRLGWKGVCSRARDSPRGWSGLRVKCSSNLPFEQGRHMLDDFVTKPLSTQDLSEFSAEPVPGVLSRKVLPIVAGRFFGQAAISASAVFLQDLDDCFRSQILAQRFMQELAAGILGHFFKKEGDHQDCKGMVLSIDEIEISYLQGREAL